METIAVIGLGNFAQKLIDELTAFDNIEIFIADKDREIVEQFRDKVKDAQIFSVINFDILKKVLPSDTKFAIVDMGHNNNETAILVTSYLKKLNIANIIVKAQGKEHAEILSLVGATQVILPDYDAAQKICQLIASQSIYEFDQISELFVMAEVKVISEPEGKMLTKSEFQSKYHLNAIAYRNDVTQQFSIIRSDDFAISPEYRIYVAGTKSDITDYIGINNESKSLSAKIKRIRNKVRR